MKPGLPQGYVEFGSVAHQILVALHGHGPMGNPELTELLDINRNSVGMTLTRLHRHKFIFIVGKQSQLTSDCRTHLLYHTKRPYLKFVPPAKATPTQRQAKYRAKLKIRVPSVFAFRGEIKIAQ